MVLYIFLPSKWLPDPSPAKDEPARDEPRPPVHGTLPGADRYTPHSTGLIFPASRRMLARSLAASLVLLAAGCLFLVLAVEEPHPGDAAEYGIGGILMVITFGATTPILSVFFVRTGGIALLPKGVYLRTPVGCVWARWDDIARVFEQHGYGSCIAFLGRSPGAFITTGLHSWNRRENRRKHGMDVAYSTWILKGDASELLAYIDLYRYDPEARADLAKPDLGFE